MDKGTAVIYIDPSGTEHTAIVLELREKFTTKNRDGSDSSYYATVASGGPHSLATLNYLDGGVSKIVHDIPHISATSVQEPNSGLPTIHLNCWKLVDEAHVAPASDHPMFDNPFAPKELDQDGNIIPPKRPQYDAQVAAHLDGKPSAADRDAAAEEEEAKEATKGKNGKAKPIAVGK